MKKTRKYAHGKRPGRSPDEDKETYVPPREEQGTSDEIAQSGRLYYAETSPWSTDYSREYIASPDDMQDLQHGTVTWVDAAFSDKNINEEIERSIHRILGHKRKKPPEYEL